MPLVKVYSTPTCPYCQYAKKFLRENNINFEDFDVTADHEKAEEMRNKSGQLSVPVIDVDGKIILGFDRAELKKALNLQ